jgi:polyhydroxyalkanoate synthesis regulator phasin
MIQSIIKRGLNLTYENLEKITSLFVKEGILTEDDKKNFLNFIKLPKKRFVYLLG